MTDDQDGIQPLGCVTGRFQPVHAQHAGLFQIALAECRHLIVAVTNADPAARRQEPASAHRHTASANPFTYFERARLLEALLRDRAASGRITIVPFDLGRPEAWSHYVPLSARQYVRTYGDWERYKAQQLEAAGYAVKSLNGDPRGRITANDIRARMRAADASWRSLVPPPTVALLDEFLTRAPMAGRA